ncbi:TetR family transcriptional regulator [Rhizobium nepotum 39/7]|jgi:AcrR family transcriptional regulator|uniref:TetR family transcriptional regulator n=3 Tax=Rhizobiaceae TaxID=82115 RepID=A0ABR5CK68_9HYPH|nr:TetR family transcriptional regulator [Rhizobium nepotum 39/7]KJF70975.1 TetR family transcriptional regulator [Agrobacterium arsenijevicii]
MPKADRRAQLLEVAHRIVRQQGTDALTLGALAEHAGVSKPITYNHFETRAGLMIALHREIMDRQVQALADAIDQTPRQLEDVARVLATTYMDCYKTVGPEWHAIGAALKGDAQMDAYQREMIDGHAGFFSKVLIPLSTLAPEVTQRRCVGIIGAGEALSDCLVRGQISRDHAVADFTDLMTNWLSNTGPNPD